VVSNELFQKLKYVKPEDSKSDSALAKHLKPGKTLVYPVDHYPGLYRSAEGKIIDLRPNDDKIIRPSIETFQKMAKSEL
jgi:hypothetical protein